MAVRFLKLSPIDYLARKQLGGDAARWAISALLSLYDIASVTRTLGDFAKSPVRAYTLAQFLALQAL